MLLCYLIIVYLYGYKKNKRKLIIEDYVKIQIVNKKPVVDEINKIMFKDMGYQSKPIETLPDVKITIKPEMLINASLPQEIISAPAPRFNVSGGQGTFRIKGSTDLYGVDFSQYLSNINGEQYLVTETSEYLNNKNSGYKAKSGTQFAGFVERATRTGKIIYVSDNGLKVETFIM
jgi:hypothetical protein